MPSVAITPGRMEILARALDRAVASAVVPRLRIDELRASFVATDVQGGSWTIDLESHRWGRLHGERWMVEDPPQQLFMDSELRASLEALEAMAARAIMTGDALQAPRTSWFRAPVPPAEPPGMPASIPSREPDTAPQPVDRKPAPLVEPARSSESMSPRASVSGTAEPATRPSEGIPPAPEPAPMAPVMSSEVFGQAEPKARGSVDTTPAPEPVPMLTVTPIRSSSLAGEPAPSVALRVAAQAAMPVERTAPSRPAIPEDHLRFAGPGFAPVSNDLATLALAATVVPEGTAPARMPDPAKLPAPVRPRDATPERERWVPTSIAPRLMSEPRVTSEPPEARDDRAPIYLCGLLAALFLALASWKGDGRGYAAALLFGLLAVTLLVLNLARSRDD